MFYKSIASINHKKHYYSFHNFISYSYFDFFFLFFPFLSYKTHILFFLGIHKSLISNCDSIILNPSLLKCHWNWEKMFVPLNLRTLTDPVALCHGARVCPATHTKSNSFLTRALVVPVCTCFLHCLFRVRWKFIVILRVWCVSLINDPGKIEC